MLNKTIYGWQIIEDSVLQEFTYVPTKKLKYKQWMKSRCYFERVQKKWNKRFGVSKELFFQMVT